MKKTSILAFLLIALGFMAKAQSQRIVTYPSTVFDGMDSITVHYNPYGIGGGATPDGGDTTFQTTSGPLYAYCYLTDSISGSGGHVGVYNNGSWTGVDTAIDSFVKVSDSDWVWTMPNVRQFFSVPKDVYVTGVNLIVHNLGGTTQSANLYIPVSESFASATGVVTTTGPISTPYSTPAVFLPSSTENVVVYYHPQLDTFNRPDPTNGDSIFRYPIVGSLYSYTYIQASNGMTYQLTSWGSVGSTPADSMVEIDSNDYAIDIPNLLGDFMNVGLPSGVSVDSLVIIPRTALGDTQTANLYTPLVITTPTVSAVANVNGNTISASVYPNPATDAIFVSYAFAQATGNNTTLNIYNMLGQVVMTQDMGKNQASNMYLSIANLPSGIYNVIVSNGNEQKVLRLSKQ